MVVNLTANKSLAMPTSGTEIGVWGPEINGNMGIIDNSFGGVATVALTSASVAVTLSSAQYQCAFIQFTGNLGSNVTATFPNVGSFYTIINDTTGSSAFFITMATTGAGGQVIGLPPGSMTDIMTIAPHVRFKALPHVGSYWDHAGSSVPAWVSGCTVPPYLYCNGGTFSSATYPMLANIYGSTTLPDFRGRAAINLNDGTGRVTSSQGGIDGNTKFAAGGIQTTSLTSNHMPNVSFPVTDPGHSHTNSNNMHTGSQSWNGGGFTIANRNLATINIFTATTGITVASGGSNAAFAVTPPAAVSGIRLVRAA